MTTAEEFLQNINLMMPEKHIIKTVIRVLHHLKKTILSLKKMKNEISKFKKHQNLLTP